MSVTTKPMTVLLQIFALILGAAACGTPSRSENAGRSAEGNDAASIAAAQAHAWTDAFQKSAALLAGEVRIEGPVGLIGHIATVSDPEELERTEKTVPEGFLVMISVKPEAQGAQITAQLDRLSIVALARLTILERPGPADVVVLANGNVYWANPETGEEKRVESLRIDGKIAR